MSLRRLTLIALVALLLGALAGGLYRYAGRRHTPPAPATQPVAREPGDPVLDALLEAGRLSPAERSQLLAVLPLILRENSQILLDRQHIDQISQVYLHEGDINEADFNWLKDIAEYYRLRPQSRSDRHFFYSLLARVDVVPPSLVLAHLVQRADRPQESLMVKSLILRQDGCRGPLCIGVSLDHGPARSVLPEPNPFAYSESGIRNYMIMLNSEREFRDFRLQRLSLRKQGRDIRGLTLVDSLPELPAGPGGYRASLRQLIILNNLQVLD